MSFKFCMVLFRKTFLLCRMLSIYESRPDSETSVHMPVSGCFRSRFMAGGVSSVPSPVSSSHVYFFSILNVYLYLPSHLLVGIWMVSEFLFNHYKQCYNKYLSFLALLSEFLEDKLPEGKFSQRVCIFFVFINALSI